MGTNPIVRSGYIPEHKEDLYGHKAKYESALRRLEKADILEKNKEILIEFHVRMCIDNLSLARKVKYLHILMSISKIMNKDLSCLDTVDIDNFKLWLNSSKLQKATQEDYIIALRKLLESLGKDISNLKVKRSRKKKLPQELLSETEVQQIIDAISTVRDKTLFSLLYETGARIGEILNMKVCDVIFDDKGAYVMLDGKTGQRRNRIIKSIPLLKEWITTVPTDDSKRFLWITKDDNRLGYPMIRKILKKLEKQLKLNKRLYPHLFRHSRSTELAKYLTEQQLKAYLGWTADSKMAGTYVHLSGKDVDNAILQINGSSSSNDSSFDEFMRFYKMWKERKIG